MHILEAAMAFAVAMMILSTLVTGIVEFIHRCLRTRKRYLVRTVRHLFDDVVLPRLRARLGAADDASLATLRDVFVQDMVVSPVSERFETRLGRAYKAAVESLTPLSFAERLGGSEVGAAMVAAGEEEARRLLTEFARAFDRYGRAASEQLHQRSRLTAVAVGVVLALSANIEAGRLMVALLEDPSLRADLVARADDAHARSLAALESLEAVTADATAAGDAEELGRLADEVGRLRADFDAARELRLPVGHDWYPWCPAGTTDPAGTPCDTGWWSAEFLRWVVLSVLAGVLIGLGGPFWFRVFTGLSRAVELLRGLGPGAGPKGGAADTTETPPAEASERPASVADAFLVAARAHQALAAVRREE